MGNPRRGRDMELSLENGFPGHPGRGHCASCLRDAEHDARFGTDLGPSGRPGARCCCYDSRTEEVRRGG